MAGTYVAEAWPEDRRKMGAGYLQTGYYFGFFVAAALNYTIGASTRPLLLAANRESTFSRSLDDARG